MSEQGEMPLGDVSLADALKANIDAPAEKWARTLAEAVDVLMAAFRRQGHDDDAALALAQHAVLTLAEWQGGRPIYWPRGDALRTAIQHRAIFHRHRGNNVEELAREYNVTERHIQRIYAEQRAIHVRRMQGHLFPG